MNLEKRRQEWIRNWYDKFEELLGEHIELLRFGRNLATKEQHIRTSMGFDESYPLIEYFTALTISHDPSFFDKDELEDILYGPQIKRLKRLADKYPRGDTRDMFLTYCMERVQSLRNALKRYYPAHPESKRWKYLLDSLYRDLKNRKVPE